MASADHVAQAFWSALCWRDVQRARSLLADGAVFTPAGMRPAVGHEALGVYLLATGEKIGAHLKTIALYEDMLIAERVGRVVGEPAGQHQAILSLVRVQDGRITSWQDFFDPSAVVALADPPRADSRVA